MALLFVWFFFAALIGSAAAADDPFVGAANWGGTGLMVIPTARVLREGQWRVGVGQVNPYRYYYGAVSPLKGLEFEGHVTEILDVPALTADYGNYRDKAADLKYQFWSEGKWTPALALGLMDPHGTRLYPSQYLVASKQIYPFDFTLGFGNGRFGKRQLPAQGEGIAIEIFSDNASWRQDGQFFAGIEFAFSEQFSLMAEYNPIRYDEQTSDPAQAKYFTEPVPSKYNFGLRWRPYEWLQTDLTYQRGNQVGVNFSMPFEIGRPMIPIYDPPYKEHPQAAKLPVERRVSLALGFAGFSSIGAGLHGKSLVIDLQNNKYLFTSRAIEMALELLTPIIRDFNAANEQKIEDVLLIFKDNGVPLFSFRARAGDMVDYADEKLSYGEFRALTSIDTGYIRVPEGRKDITPNFALGYKPQIQLLLNDPSGFWKGKIGLSLWATHPLWDGGALTAGVAAYPLTNIDTSNPPLSIPVRTDSVNYIKNKLLFERFLFTQVNRVPETSIFTRFTAGILETQYAGLDAETAMPVMGGRFLFGLSGSLVKKRDTANPFLLAENDVKDYYKTAFFNTRINFPGPEVAVDVKYGMFLAGDKGTRVTVSKYIKGVTISAWYSWTDTSVFTDGINNDYHDKGILVLIPVRLFTGSDSRAVYAQGVSPWTRDVAQDIEHFSTLFDFIGKNTDIYLKKKER